METLEMEKFGLHTSDDGLLQIKKIIDFVKFVKLQY